MNRLPSLPEHYDEPAWDRLIQQCADGELDECAERELLARLEFQPAGWRQLALACVEGRLLRRVGREWLADSCPPPPPCFRRASRPVWFRGAAKITAAALLLLVTFVAGRWSAPRAEFQQGSSMVAVQSQDGHGTVKSAGDRTPVAAERRSAQPSSDSEWPDGATPASVDAVPTPVTYVGLLLPGSDAAIEVPVYRASESLAEWQPFEHPVLSAEEAEALRKAGYNVEWQRELLTLTSAEGEPILLPLESVRVEPSRY
jgi:hypothetical protein